MWQELRRYRIPAERQEFVKFKRKEYALDFAIYCAKGNVDVETDGDFWHINPEGAAKDNLRDNDLETLGWRVLRFTTGQLKEEMACYCLPQVVENINRLGGLDEGKTVPRKIDLSLPPGSYQPSLFALVSAKSG